jgi:uncharacterized DUF497 family protein
MKEIIFEWNSQKNASNKVAHKISFEEAQTVFYDENARVIHDVKHSDEENRFIILGYSYKANLLIVCHCYRNRDEIVRIISARKANKTESIQYLSFNKGNKL